MVGNSHTSNALSYGNIELNFTYGKKNNSKWLLALLWSFRLEFGARRLASPTQDQSSQGKFIVMANQTQGLKTIWTRDQSRVGYLSACMKLT